MKLPIQPKLSVPTAACVSRPPPNACRAIIRAPIVDSVNSNNTK